MVGSIQIRNRATLVGNVCNASPAADMVPVLAVYGAVVKIIGRGGERSLPLVTSFRAIAAPPLWQASLPRPYASHFQASRSVLLSRE